MHKPNGRPRTARQPRCQRVPVLLAALAVALAAACWAPRLLQTGTLPEPLLLDADADGSVSACAAAGAGGAPLVSLLIPVHNGSWALPDALAAAGAQTYAPLEVLASIEPGPDAAASARAFLAWARAAPPGRPACARAFLQRQRLGWTANTNFLLARAAGAYATVLPHDDTVPPEYVAKLAACLDARPSAVNCYPRREHYFPRGRANVTWVYREVLRQPNITGDSPAARVAASLRRKAGASFRGLVRRQGGRGFAPFYLQRLHADHSAADLVQITQHAVAGELVEADVPYFKRIVPTSWYEVERKRLTDADQLAALADRCAATYAAAASAVASSAALHAGLKNMLLERLRMRAARRAAPPAAAANASAANASAAGAAAAAAAAAAADAGADDLAAATLARFAAGVRRRRRAAVLGAGIQGVCAALALAARGMDVTLYDAAGGIMRRASANQEGKIHLGFVYSKDASMDTGRALLRAALAFAPTLERLAGRRIDWAPLRSAPFTYLVPHDSLVPPAEVAAFFARVQAAYRDELAADPGLHYLGARPWSLFRAAAPPRGADAARFAAAFETEEVAVAQAPLAAVLLDALERRGVRLVLNSTVSRVERLPPGAETGAFRVTSTAGRHDADAVVNCLWHDRARVDAQLGLPAWSGDNLRLKFGVTTPALPELARLPSVTIVNGPYGDFVAWPPGGPMYMSWYPAAMRGMVANASMPAEWAPYLSGDVPPRLAAELLAAHEAAFNAIFPGARGPWRLPAGARLLAGVIVANGRTDVADPESGLHRRADPAVRCDRGYCSISTQKFTSGPANAAELERAMFGGE